MDPGTGGFTTCEPLAPRNKISSRHRFPVPSIGLLLVYAAVMFALLVGSITGAWPFPALWPQNLTWSAWQQVVGSHRSLWTSVWLALASSTAALGVDRGVAGVGTGALATTPDAAVDGAAGAARPVVGAGRAPLQFGLGVWTPRAWGYGWPTRWLASHMC